VALINQSMAQALFPHENPLGRRIGNLDPNDRGWMQIVGVIADQDSVISFNAPATRFQVMRPLAQETWNHVTVTLRAQSPEILAEPLRHAIAGLDSDMAVQQLDTVDEAVAHALSSTSMIDTLLVTCALLGLFLAAIGLYGVIARLVTQRTPEIGVRIALGAQSSDVFRLVLGTGIRLTLLGTAFGLIGVYAMARFLWSIAPAFASQDFRSVIGATLALVVVALLASWLPARRATKVDPVVALRAD
jgi:predicted lysophospholipase L1 biosynthesis ABC-type transport system permease subunit